MCKHVRVKYACGHIRYCVMCWCSKYTDLQKCCPLKVRRHETLSFQVCGKYIPKPRRTIFFFVFFVSHSY
ncbi:uncharacterized protein SEPMUDRAFT_65937 [Sphaerulina musiva SO2202]|uniref:Uncharacterized protein n=1 Tax=Sphaerulina musiva (strain SO2202) TaxID=692275 RepID=M3BX70_SPHMS|nr:uncharacterized protein SEPMUDRAFT_65937 [Sphaerulina musiva SO2202]EMF12666.1 hypothetical protein SEPMUDRAFT_65937 [Sphaerulina musiva SO2202]